MSWSPEEVEHFFGETFRGFDEKMSFHQVREREYGVRRRNDAKITIFDAQPYFWNYN